MEIFNNQGVFGVRIYTYFLVFVLITFILNNMKTVSYVLLLIKLLITEFTL